MDNTDKNISFVLPTGKRIVLFVCLAAFCYILANLLADLLIYFKGPSTSVLRIVAVIQDVIVFVLPVVITAILITRLPARLLCIENKPDGVSAVLACVALLLSIPAMNALVAWNESITLPQGLAELENWMRQSEESAREMVVAMIGGRSVGNIILAFLIVAVFAGFSEELFFRGGLQRLLTTSGMNAHVAIWFVAFIFSATHLQFYGFFGRLLIGAYLGYLLWWSRSLWIPIIVHIFNNAVYLCGVEVYGLENNELDMLGADCWWLICLSVILTAGCLVLLKKRCGARK